jgi:hypothetical protein
MATGRAAAGDTYVPQGMVAPLNPFLDEEGNLTAVSFRFLFGLFSHLNYVHDEVEEIKARLAAAGIP